MVIASQQCDVGDETRVVPQPVGLDVGARAVDDFEDSANGQRPDRFTHRCSRHVQEPGQLGLGRQWRLLFEHSIGDGVEDLSDGLLDPIASHTALILLGMCFSPTTWCQNLDVMSVVVDSETDVLPTHRASTPHGDSQDARVERAHRVSGLQVIYGSSARQRETRRSCRRTWCSLRCPPGSGVLTGLRGRVRQGERSPFRVPRRDLTVTSWFAVDAASSVSF